MGSNGSRIRLVQGDITVQQVDAIVNAANTSLLGGGGVDGAIHRAAGPGLLEESRAIGGCPTGQARLTSGHSLPARWVIHAVGPVWRGGAHGEAELLASCYRSVFAIAIQPKLGIRTIAIPGISTGVYGYPHDKAATIALSETSQFLATDDSIHEVRFVLFSTEMLRIYESTLSKMG